MAQDRDDVRDTAEAFRRHYEDESSGWGKNSGAGSNAYYTIEYRAFLEKFIRMNSVKSVIDIGCGDWQFSRYLNFSGIRYDGYDIVSSVIERNKRDYEKSRDNVEFHLMPSNLEDVKSAELLIMKDVLQHLPDQQILSFYSKLIPRFKYCLLTNSYKKLNARQNINIQPGQFRCVDLNAEPYCFGGAYVFEFATPIWEFIRTMLIVR